MCFCPEILADHHQLVATGDTGSWRSLPWALASSASPSKSSAGAILCNPSLSNHSSNEFVFNFSILLLFSASYQSCCCIHNSGNCTAEIIEFLLIIMLVYNTAIDIIVARKQPGSLSKCTISWIKYLQLLGSLLLFCLLLSKTPLLLSEKI
jgi:hypothetical protein